MEEQENLLVLDTNIILLDHLNILVLGKNHTIVIPETVIEELDAKKTNMAELGFQARAFGRLISAADIEQQYTTEELCITELIAEDVKILIVSTDEYPAAATNNDRKIIHIAKRVNDISTISQHVTFMSNDVNCRIQAMANNLDTTDLKEVEQTTYEFLKHLSVASDIFTNLHNAKILDVDPDYQPENFNYIVTDLASGATKLGQVRNGTLEIIGRATEAELRKQDVNPRNSEQLLMSKAIQSDADVVLVEARAGSGKSLIAISNAMKLVKGNNQYQSILYVRASIDDVEKVEEVGFLSQPLRSKVLTPTGWTTIGDIAIGTEVCTPSGTLAKVETLSPVTKKLTYKITTNTNKVTYASGEHLWEIEYAKKARLMTTEAIKAQLESKDYKSRNMYLPTVHEQSYCTKKQLLDPYLIGYLIGDGILGGSHVRVAIGDEDSEESATNLKKCISKDFPEYDIARSLDLNYCYTISKPKAGTTRGNKIREYLEEYDLLHGSCTKRIPEDYMYGDKAQRISLLQGLIDSDGSIRESRYKGSEVLYYSCNLDLINDVADLVTGLGGRSKIRQTATAGKTTILGTECNRSESYSLSISGLDFVPARLTRKANRYVKCRSQRTKIVAVEVHKEELVRCIGLNNDEHLYLTDGLIPTHNSGNDEKFAVYFHPLLDSIGHIVRTRIEKSKSKVVGQELDTLVESKVEDILASYCITPLTGLGMRGRTFTNSIIIIDEVQGQSKASLRKMLTRVGKDCKVIVIGSQRQIDNAYVTKFNNGFSVLLNQATAPQPGIKLQAITLNKVVRSPLAEWSEDIFDKN